LFAKLNDARFVVGIIVDDMPCGKSAPQLCRNELHVIDAATIAAFLKSIDWSDK
jgi:hypothetical protein